VAAKHCKVHRGNYVVTLCLYVLHLLFVDIVLCILLQVWLTDMQSLWPLCTLLIFELQH